MKLPIPKYILFHKNTGLFGDDVVTGYTLNTGFRPDRIKEKIRVLGDNTSPAGSYSWLIRSDYTSKILGADELPQGIEEELNQEMLDRLIPISEYFKIASYGKATLYHRYEDNIFLIKCLDIEEEYDVNDFASYTALLNQCRELELKIPESILKL